jgi:hypothetical protein
MAMPDRGAICDHPRGAPTHGQAAVDGLGAEGLAAAAFRTSRSAESLRSQLLADPTLWIDSCGMTFYADPGPPPASPTNSPTTAPPAAAAAAIPYTQTFLLHSKPGSNRVIYLDFNGESIPANSAWASTKNGGVGWVAPPFDTDLDPTTFSTGEQDQIQNVWQRVSEDYAPLDVDVQGRDRQCLPCRQPESGARLAARDRQRGQLDQSVGYR